MAVCIVGAFTSILCCFLIREGHRHQAQLGILYLYQREGEMVEGWKKLIPEKTQGEGVEGKVEITEAKTYIEYDMVQNDGTTLHITKPIALHQDKTKDLIKLESFFGTSSDEEKGNSNVLAVERVPILVLPGHPKSGRLQEDIEGGLDSLSDLVKHHRSGGRLLLGSAIGIWNFAFVLAIGNKTEIALYFGISSIWVLSSLYQRRKQSHEYLKEEAINPNECNVLIKKKKKRKKRENVEKSSNSGESNNCDRREKAQEKVLLAKHGQQGDRTADNTSSFDWSVQPMEDENTNKKITRTEPDKKDGIDKTFTFDWSVQPVDENRSDTERQSNVNFKK